MIEWLKRVEVMEKSYIFLVIYLEFKIIEVGFDAWAEIEGKRLIVIFYIGNLISSRFYDYFYRSECK